MRKGLYRWTAISSMPKLPIFRFPSKYYTLKVPLFIFTCNPMFKNEATASKVGDTVIGPSVKVEGHFVGEGNVSVEGQLQGSLKTKHNVSIGAAASVKADVEGVDIFLAGDLTGNVKAAGKFTLTSSARLTGNVEAASLSVEEGARISGKCSIGGGVKEVK